MIDISFFVMPKRKLDPLPSTAFHILLALAGEDLHGYAIMRQVEQQTRGRVRLGPGTLYGSLRTLVEAGLIEELDDNSVPKDSSERRRYYRLTSAGLRLVRSEVDGLAQTLRVARTKRILRGADV
jgi:DNA-binding PadR family transcriptional regulator